MIQFFHRPPGAVHIPDGLVDQVKVQPIELQFLQGPFKRLAGVLIPGIRYPQLGRYKQVFPCHAAAFDRFSDRFFIAVRSCGVDQAVPGLDGFNHAAFAFFGIGDLKNAEPEHGHFHAVI